MRYIEIVTIASISLLLVLATLLQQGNSAWSEQKLEQAEQAYAEIRAALEALS